MDDSLFFKNLLEKHKDLVEVAVRKKYTFIVPLAKYITPNMLTRSFYDNHTFFQCEYDPKLYVNLAGRVLECRKDAFQTFLGFRRAMAFNVTEELMREVTLNVYMKVLYVDNVIDETVYNQNPQQTATRKDLLRRCASKEEYVKFFLQLTKANEELKEVEAQLKELVDKLQNNYILIKGHVHTYYKYFQELTLEFRTFLSLKLARYKLDESFNLVVHELSEALIYHRIYHFLFLNLKQFNVDEEAELKLRMENLKADFSFSMYKLDSGFNECKFKAAIAELKKVSQLTAPFEKLAVLNAVNALIEKEAKDCLEKNAFKKKSFNLTTDELLPMWIYVLINAEVPNVLTERCLLQDFTLKMTLNENDFILILFIQAVESFKRESGAKYSNVCISPIVINTATTIPEPPTESFMSSRSQSIASTRSAMTDGGLFSSIKGMIFK